MTLGKIPQTRRLSDASLARALGCDRTSLPEWRRRGDAPVDNNLETWREYCQKHGLGRFIQKTKTQLQEDKLRRDIKLADLKIAREEGNMVDVDTMANYVARFSAKLDQLLTQKIEVELPPRVQGKDIVEIRREARAVHDEIREIYNKALPEWKPSTN